jgi:hypothetical protein
LNKISAEILGYISIAIEWQTNKLSDRHGLFQYPTSSGMVGDNYSLISNFYHYYSHQNMIVKKAFIYVIYLYKSFYSILEKNSKTNSAISLINNVLFKLVQSTVKHRMLKTVAYIQIPPYRYIHI